MCLAEPTPFADCPTTVTVVGDPSHAVFPDICVNCAGAASRRFRYEQSFPRLGDEGQLLYHQVYSADIPLCPTCWDEQSRQAPPLSRLKRLLLLGRTWYAIGLVGSALCGLYVLQMGVREVLDGSSALVELAIASTFAAIAVYHFRAAWQHSHYRAIPRETEVTSAIAFSDDLSALFEPSRHEFSFRNTQCAARFHAANVGRQWDAQGTRARMARSGWMIVLVLVVVVLVFVIGQWLGLID